MSCGVSALLAAMALLAVAATATPLASATPPPRLGTLRTKLEKKLVIHAIDYSWLLLTCPEGSSLDSLSKQPFEERQFFRRINVSRCPPDASSYRSVLDALNATLIGAGGLTVRLPAGGQPLAARHLHGLELATLDLIAFSKRRPPAGVAADLLAGQGILSALVVRNVPVSADVLAAASDTLTSLVLEDAGTDRVPPALLARLNLLSVKSESPVELEGSAPALHTLSLRSAGLAGTRTNWTLYPNLTTLSLSEWSGSPEPWIGCGSLQDLTITRSTVTALPARWLGTCCALRELKVYYACRLDVSALPESLLEGCGTRDALIKLVLRKGRCGAGEGGGVEDKPGLHMRPLLGAGMAPNLRVLDLSGNELTSLDRRLFANLIGLEMLYLSGNRFNKSIYNLMTSLTTLKELDLSGNKLLGDACEGGEYVPSGPSPLRTLTQLRMLDLSDTGVSLICQDWREKLLRLKSLNLGCTNVTHLSMRDLRFRREDGVLDAEMSLLGTRVAAVNYSDPDVRRVLDGSLSLSHARVLLDSPLHCDCHMYNARYAWNENTRHVTFGIPKPKCGTVGGKKLSHKVDVDLVPLESMVCPNAEVCSVMPSGCECWVRPQLKPRSRVPSVIRVKVACEGLGLRALPRVLYPFNDTFSVEWELYFRNNSITELSALPSASRGTHVIKILDLRYNKLRRVSPEAATALAAGASASDNHLEELQLGGNELRCDCGAGPLLATVAALSVTGTKLGDARCGGTDTRTLVNASADVAHMCVMPQAGAGGVTLGVTLGSVVAVLALAALAVGGALVRPSWRARLKGVLLYLLRPDPETHSFDMTHSTRTRLAIALAMADLKVREEMAGLLESAQIAHSVRLSRHFLTSEWVRAELKEAQAASVRDSAAPLASWS